MKYNNISLNEPHPRVRKLKEISPGGKNKNYKLGNDLIILGKKIPNLAGDRQKHNYLLKNAELVKSISMASLIPRPRSNYHDLNKNLDNFYIENSTKNKNSEKLFFYNKINKKPKFDENYFIQDPFITNSFMFKSNVPRLMTRVQTTPNENIGPGTFYKEIPFVKNISKESFFFKKRSCSSKLKRTIELEQYFSKNSIHKNYYKNQLNNKKGVPYKRKYRLPGKEIAKPKEKTDKTESTQENIDDNISYCPKKEISSIFKSRSLKGLFIEKNHIPGPSYYDPMPIPKKVFFKNTQKIWM